MHINDRIQFAQNFGLIVENIISDATLHRTPTVEKPRSKDGYYISFDNGILCGNWATGLESFFSSRTHTLRAQDYKKIKDAKNKADLEKEVKYYKARLEAQNLYKYADLVSSHTYLNFKGVNPTSLMRKSGDALLIPMFDLFSMRLKNIQKIYPNGKKYFLTGGQITGLCFVINQPNHRKPFKDKDLIIIAEGVATALSIAEESRAFTIATMNAGNLKPVGIKVRSLYPSANVIICGDDDYKSSLKTGVNIGKQKAKECANYINASLSFPPFEKHELEAGMSDWNDYYQSRKEASHVKCY